MDEYIVISATLVFGVWVAMLPIIFRIRSEESSMCHMIYAALMCAVLLTGIVGHRSISMNVDIWNTAVALIYAVSIYVLLVFVFIFGIYSVFEASLTLRFLLEIASGKVGITKHELLSRYGVRTIVKRRLERLIESKDIVDGNGTFLLAKHASYFRIREQALSLLRYIFP